MHFINCQGFCVIQLTKNDYLPLLHIFVTVKVNEMPSYDTQSEGKKRLKDKECSHLSKGTHNSKN